VWGRGGYVTLLRHHKHCGVGGCGTGQPGQPPARHIWRVYSSKNRQVFRAILDSGGIALHTYTHTRDPIAIPHKVRGGYMHICLLYFISQSLVRPTEALHIYVLAQVLKLSQVLRFVQGLCGRKLLLQTKEFVLMFPLVLFVLLRETRSMDFPYIFFWTNGPHLCKNICVWGNSGIVVKETSIKKSEHLPLSGGVDCNADGAKCANWFCMHPLDDGTL